MPTNPQEEFWSGPAGKTYMRRNDNPDKRYIERQPFFDLFEGFSRDMAILEVGCNVGINLSILQNLGFTNLHGIDIYSSAVEVAKQFVPGANFSVGTLMKLPYANEEFGAVFSSGVLIHQDPTGPLFTAMNEMIRCSSRYILGFEDYADTFEAPGCYNRSDLYWRGPYSHLWKDPECGLHLEERAAQRAAGTLAYFKKGAQVGAADLASPTAAANSAAIEKTKNWSYVKESYRFSKKKKEA